MNKKVSKALAAVLSAAMAASAFAMSTSASFAAGSDVQFSVKDIPLTLTTKSDDYDLDTLITSNNPVTATKDGQELVLDTLQPITDENWVSSNEKIAKVDPVNGTVTIADDAVTSRQTVTFTRKYQATVKDPYENGTHTETNKGDTAVVTIKIVASIYPDGSYVILPALTSTYDEASVIDSNKTVSINETANFNVYKIEGKGGWGTDITDVENSLSGLQYAVSNNLTTIDNTTNKGQTAAQPTNNVKTGSATISATADGVEIQSASLTVEDTYAFDSGDSLSVSAEYGQDTATIATDDDNSDAKYDVTGMDIVATTAINTTDARMNLGNIKSTANVQVNQGVVGDITTSGTVVVTNTGDEDITVGNIDADNVQILGSDDANGPATTVGNVTADVDNDSSVEVTSYEATENGQTVGAGDVTVGNITTSGTLTLSADTINTMTLGNLSGVQGYYENCPYTADLVVKKGTFNLNDLLYFGSVTINDGAYVTAGAIDTGTKGTADDKSTVDSKVTVNGRLTADSIKTYDFANATGTVIVPVNSVEVTGTDDTNSGVTLLVKDAKVGDVLYTSTKSNDDLFVMPGVKALEGKDSGKNVYTYTVTDLEFRGVLMEQTGTVEVGTAGTTLSVVKIPFTTNPPAGVSIVWETNKPDSVTLTPSADGLSCKVTPVGYTENNLNGSNDVTVTASLYKDGKPYSELDTQYASTSVDLTLTGKAPEAPANPFTVVVTNAEGEKITCAADGSTVIEVPQSMAFNFDISSEETQPFDYTVGNGSIGGTNTNTVWNGTSGQYQIYAAGAVGSETGAYVNGIKIFTLKVTDRPFESDTTLNMDLKVGQKYQFEITLDDPAAPFTFLTADGAALSTSYNPDTYPAENGKYYCSVTAQQAGRDIGVYCVIDGKTYKIFTAHTVA